MAVVREETIIVERSSPASRIIYLLLDIIEGLLVIRFILLLLGASAASGFARLIYRLSAPFVAPFRGIAAASPFGPGVVEWSSLFAMITYAVVAMLIARILRAGR